MKHFSYMVTVGLSLVMLLFLIPSQPVVYKAEANSTRLLDNITTLNKWVVKEGRDCSCIVGAREYGVDIPYNTNADDLEPNGIPEIGGLILLSYSKSYHVAVNVEFGEDGILVYEENFNNPEGGCRKGFRLISWEEVGENARGFWTKPESDDVDKLVLRL